MNYDVNDILSVLDRSSHDFHFPALDYGYVYLAATRLSLFRSADDWAMVIEVFGFSPRSGLPDTNIHTLASKLHDRNPPDHYVSREAYERYLANKPHNESRFIFPVDDGPWLDGEFVAVDAKEVIVRGQACHVPSRKEYAQHGIDLEQRERVHVSELCRLLTTIAPDRVLANSQERRVSVSPEMEQILQLEEWHHPDVVGGERPSASETFQQLAQALVSGNVQLFRPSEPPNTHWRNWPDGDSL
jgi:hypothetical protein